MKSLSLFFLEIVGELKNVISNCKTLGDIEKIMVGHYKNTADIAKNKVIFVKTRIKITEKKILFIKWKKYKKMHGIRTGAAMVGGRRRRAPKRRRRIRRGRGVEEDSSLDSCARLAAKKWHIPIEQARKIIEEYALYNHITYKCEFDNSLSKYGPYASRADVVRSELAQDLDYAGLKDRVAKRKKLARQIEREYGITGEYPATQNDARVFYQKGINKNTDSLARLKELISASEYPGDIY